MLGLKLRPPGEDSRSEHPRGPNPGALGLSVVLHGTVIGWALLSTSSPAVTKNTPTVYEQFIAPEEKKIVWYRVQELPRIAPGERIGTNSKPQAEEKQDKVLISVAPEADPAKQLIFRPDVAKRIVKDIPTPDLVAVEAAKETAKPEKIFRPPPPPLPQRAQFTTVEPAPPDILKGMPSTAPVKIDAFLTPQPRIAKAFVPPTKPPARIDPAPQLLASAEPAVLQGPQDQRTTALDEVFRGSSKLPTRPFVPPSASHSTGTKPGSGIVSSPPSLMAGDVNAAVLSTSAVDKLVTAIPEGSRPAQMSGAPTVGPTASGAASGLRIPGVVVQPADKPGNKLIPIPELTGRVVYEETRVSASQSTLSAALRPSSRTIPANIEARFRGRVEYTIVVPKPRLPLYNGDWILWFAERQPMAGDAPQMRAPQPARKVESGSGQPQVLPTGRVQLAATILKTGRVDAISVLNGLANPFTQAAINDLQSWSFTPAVRDGQPVDVDIVVEIPFQ